MEPIAVGIDIDDTLCDFTGPLNEYVNQFLSHPVSRNDYDERTLGEIWKVDETDAQDLIKKFIYRGTDAVPPGQSTISLTNSDISRDYTPFPYSQECLANLKRSGKFKFYAVTARDYELTNETKIWLERYYPGIFSDIFVCNHFGNNNSDKICKTDVCKEHGIKIFIDDRPENIKCSSILTVVYDQLWNRKSAFPRVCNWKEVEMFLLNQYLILKSEPIRIGISGKIGSGKSCVAEMIGEMLPCFIFTEFARRLKDTISAMTATPKKLCYSREGKAVIPRGFNFTIGQLLQKVSETLKKELGYDIWINSVIESEQFDQHVVVGDTRLKIEANALVQRGTILLRINGDPLKIREKNEDGRDLNHISETDLDDYPFESACMHADEPALKRLDHVIENNGTLDELRENVRKFLLEILL